MDSIACKASEGVVTACIRMDARPLTVYVQHIRRLEVARVVIDGVRVDGADMSAANTKIAVRAAPIINPFERRISWKVDGWEIVCSLIATPPANEGPRSHKQYQRGKSLR